MTDAAPTTTAAPAGQAADAAAAAAAAPAPTAPAPTDPAAPAAGTEPPAAEPNAEPWNDPATAKRIIEDLRRENGNDRINAKTAAADEARTEMAKALLAVIDPAAAAAGKAATPEELMVKLNDTSTERDGLKRDNAIARAALEASVHPTKLAFLEFTLSRDAELAAIAPGAEGFGATLKARIEAAIAADPSIKTPGAVTTTGAEGFAGSNDPQAVTKTQYDAMSLIERGELLKRDPDTYRRLAAAS